MLQSMGSERDDLLTNQQQNIMLPLKLHSSAFSQQSKYFFKKTTSKNDLYVDLFRISDHWNFCTLRTGYVKHSFVRTTWSSVLRDCCSFHLRRKLVPSVSWVLLCSELKSLQMVTAAMKLKDTYFLERKL